MFLGKEAISLKTCVQRKLKVSLANKYSICHILYLDPRCECIWMDTEKEGLY